MAPGISQRRIVATTVAVLLALASPIGCGSERATDPAPPNILWVVWDTVRASNMSLYGHERPTTPYLEQWAREARVFDDAVSAAPTTIPSHASMFTGRFPVEHGANDGTPKLAPTHQTIAEILRDAGYQTYLFSANPYLGNATGLVQGFERVEHPWSPVFGDSAARILAEKTRHYAGAGEGSAPDWAKHVKTAGALAQTGLERWLSSVPPEQPFLAVLNYMEAHQPLVPGLRFRQALMTERELETSYREPVLGAEQWAFTAGVEELSAARLAALELTYDASIAELDHYFEQLIAALERRGLLDDTLVVLTSDHGELLGEHHLLDHQYSVHEPLLWVPLVLRHPRLVPSGREPRPVMNLDLFVTLLGLAGVPQAAQNARGVDLLAPHTERARLSEYPFAPRKYVGLTALAWPDFDPTPFFRSLRAFRSGTLKYVQASDGTHELYDLAEDPGETTSLVNEKPEVAASLDLELEHYLSDLVSDSDGERPEPGTVEFGDETRKMLDALGY